jgi:hypothetical protein
MGNDSSFTESDRRSGLERRQIIYELHIPERRRGPDRRDNKVENDKSKTPSKNINGEKDHSEPAEK